MASDGRFTDAEHRQILDAIGAAERLTSGEIRLFVEDVAAARTYSIAPPTSS